MKESQTVFKELYEDSHANREKTRDSLGLVFGLVTPNIGVVFYMYQELPKLDSALAWSMFAILIAATLLFGWVTYLLWLVFKGETNAYVGPPLELRKYYLGLLKYHQATIVDQEIAGQKSEEEFSDYLSEKYVEAAQLNADKNIRRADALYLSKRVFLAGTICLALSAFIFVSLKRAEEKITKVQVASTYFRIGGVEDDRRKEDATATASTTSTPNTTGAAGTTRTTSTSAPANAQRWSKSQARLGSAKPTKSLQTSP